MKYNIFQGNEDLLNVIAQELQVTPKTYQDLGGIIASSLTEDFYFEAFFYLTKRFGEGKPNDTYKEAAVWDFEVKDYIIRVCFETSSIDFMMFGDAKHYINVLTSPYWIHKVRKMEKVSKEIEALLCDSGTENGLKNTMVLYADFCKKNNIEVEFSDLYYYSSDLFLKFYMECERYNEGLTGVENYDVFESKHGMIYQNAKTRNALKVMRQFLRNMLSPIFIRDVAYNIKGECDMDFVRYSDNIEIKKVNECKQSKI
jgi:hypothetical protein